MAEEAVICVDHLHHIVVFNQGAERIFGYAARDILGQSLSRLIPARFMQDHGRHMSGFSAQVTSTRAMNPQREIYGLRSDGTEFPAEASITRATDKGNILLSVVLRDITERTRAQNELSLSEARFRSFFEQSAVGMVIASDSGAFLQVNQQFADIIGYTQEEIVGQLCAEATHPDDRGHEAASIAKLLDGKSTGSTWEKRYVRKDGRAVWCLLSLSLLNLKEDNSRQFIGVVKDITDRKRAEEALAQSQTLLRIAGDAAKLGGWVVDLPGYVVHWSDEVRAIHQVPPDFEPTLAQGIGFYPPEYRPQVAEHVRHCAEDGTPFNFEHELITATGRRIWVQAIGEAVLDQQGAIVGIQNTLQDISARKASEASLAESQRRFRAMADSQ